MQPGQLLVAKEMLRRFEPARVVERADMEMRLIRQLRGLAGEGGAAARAEPARRAGRGFESGDLPFGHRVRVALEADENRDRRAAVPATALAMTPEHTRGLAGRDEADGAAEAAAFGLVVGVWVVHEGKPEVEEPRGSPAAFHSGKPSSRRRTLKPRSRSRATASKASTQ